MRIALTIATCTAMACGAAVDNEAPAAPPADAPSRTAAPAFTPAQMSAAAAQCDAPHGGVERYTTVTELVALLSGAWFYCHDPAGERAQDSIQGRGGPAARAGLEFTSDGHFYWLSPDPSGTVVRGRGMTEIAGYTIYPPNDARYNNVSFQIDIIYPNGNTMPTRATFETGPRRLALQNWSGFFVPIAAGAP